MRLSKYNMFILLLCFIFTNSCTSLKKIKMRLSTNPYQDDINSIKRGGIVYQKNCLQCHGKDALGRKNISSSVLPANLILYSKNRASQTIALHIAYGKGDAMPSFEKILTQKEIWDVSNYLKKISE